MSRVLNLSYSLRNSIIYTVRIPQCNYGSNKGSKQNDKTSTVTTAAGGGSIEPLPMAYNSYENLSNVQTTSPILIMHGVYNQSILKYTPSELIIYFFWPYENGYSGLLGSKQNWRSIGKAIHSKTNPTRKVKVFLLFFWIEEFDYWFYN